MAFLEEKLMHYLSEELLKSRRKMLESDIVYLSDNLRIPSSAGNLQEYLKKRALKFQVFMKSPSL